MVVSKVSLYKYIYLDLPQGAEWMIRGAYTPSFGIKQHPLEDAGIFLNIIFIFDFYLSRKLTCPFRVITIMLTEKVWLTLPETSSKSSGNFTETQKERMVFQPSFLRGELLISFRRSTSNYFKDDSIIIILTCIFFSTKMSDKKTSSTTGILKSNPRLNIQTPAQKAFGPPK